MAWKKNLNDPQYLMDMRRPTFIVSRAVGLSTQRLIGAQPRWLFIDLMQTIKDLIATRPGIPNIVLPANLSEANTIEHNVAEALGIEPKIRAAKKMPTLEKRISRRIKKLLR